MTISAETDTPPRIVVFGGGTGMFSLLSGIKRYTRDITAIITVTDDGGSSGLLRQDLDIPPPGDIRNCLLALSDAHPLLKKSLDLRFSSGELKNHSLGNLLIAASAMITKDFGKAVKQLHEVLRVQGKVIPCTNQKTSLVADHGNGYSTTGEVRITRSGLPVNKLELRPEPAFADREILDAIARADLFIFGPGSLFTSIIPNLLVPGIVEAVMKRNKPRLYIANIMTQKGETSGFTLSDHIRAIERHSTDAFLTGILASGTDIPAAVLHRYKEEGSEPVMIDKANLDSYRIHTQDLADTGQYMRHNPEKLAHHIFTLFWYQQSGSTTTATKQ